MIKVVINEKGGGERVLSFSKDTVSVGRSQRNDVILPRSNVSKKHATVDARGGSVIVTDHNSTNGTFVNGRRLTAPAILGPEDRVFISDFIISFEATPGEGVDLESTFPPPLPRPSAADLEDDEREIIEPLTVPPAKPVLEPEEEPEEELEPEDEPEDELEDELEEEPEPVEEDEVEPLEEAPESVPGPGPAPPLAGADADRVREVETELFKQLDALLDLERVEPRAFRDQDFRKKTSRTIAELLDAMVDSGRFPAELEPSRVAGRLASEILELGPLGALLEDPTVTEIIVPARGDVCVHTTGGVRTLDDPFVCDKSRQLVMRKLMTRVRDHGGEGGSAVRGDLEGGEEIFMLLPPVVLEGAAVVIRKPPVGSEGGMDGLVERGILSSGMARFLGYCIEARQGVLICDPGLGSHRTIIPAMAGMLEPWERLVALQCGRAPLYDLEPQVYAVLSAGGEESLGIEVTTGDLVQVIGAFRPTAVIAGDIRSMDHFRLIRQAGSSKAFTVSTIDAESEMDGLARMGGWLAREHSIIPRAVATGILLDAINIVVFHTRLMDGSEKITRVSELVPGKEGLPTLKPIFHFDVSSVKSDGTLEGTFKSTRHVPGFLDSRKARGRKLDPSIFQ